MNNRRVGNLGTVNAVASVLALAAVVGCSTPRAATRGASATASVAVAGGGAAHAGAVVPPAGRTPYYLDPSEDCGLLAAALYPDAEQLVRRYMAEDNAGRFLESTPLMDSVYVCPNHLPGPDEFTVVSESTVGGAVGNDSAAHVVVRSTQLGWMTQDSVGLVFVREPATVVDAFVVIHTPYGWRIESPQLPDRVLGSTVLDRPDRFRLRPAVHDSLARSVSRPAT